MQGKSIVRLLIVLAVLVGVFVIVKLTDSSGRSESFRSTLVEINDEQVSKIELMSPEDTTTLEKTDGQWKVNGQYAADANTVKGLMNNLKTIKPSRLASRTEDSWKDYQVDAAGTRVIAYEGNDKTLDIILGRFNVEGQRQYASYVRLFEDTDVYVAKNFMKMSVNTAGSAYRNDDILRIQQDSVELVAFNYPDSAFDLTRGISGWEAGGAIADSASVAKYFQGVKFLNSRSFAEKDAQEKAYEVTFRMNNGEEMNITAFGSEGVASSYNPAEYWQDAAVREKVFKSKGYFVNE